MVARDRFKQGRTQDLVQRGALFKICLLSTARSVVFCFRAKREYFFGVRPPPEQDSEYAPGKSSNFDTEISIDDFPHFLLFLTLLP